MKKYLIKYKLIPVINICFFQTKYNVEKLTHDADFLQSEIGHLSHAIADINKDINAQISIKKTLVLFLENCIEILCLY